MRRLVGVFLVCLIFLFTTACSEKDIILDTESLLNDLTQNIDFEDELSEINSAMVISLYGISSETTARVFISSGATAEEIAVFESVDVNKAKETLEVAKQHIQNQKDEFENYIPKEVDKLNNAIVIHRGKYVIICVTDDDKAQGIIDKYLK